ncbi:MAG: hypothetical protein ABI237_18725 [Ginsengibacter sp.]
MQQFEIILRNDKIKMYRTIAWIFLLLNFSVFIFLLFYDVYHYPAMAFILALGLYLLLRWYLFKKGNSPVFLDEFVFFIPAAGWFGLHSYMVAIGCLLMGILYKLSLQKIKIIFTRGNIIKTNFPKKEFNWNEFNNVILKDDILTLDFKNNKLLQAQIENDDINETDFNSFAHLQISKVNIPAV